MRVFAGLDPLGTEETLLAAAGAVADRLADIPEPRSLCEIAPDEEDYAWLRQWARSLGDPMAYKWLGRVPVRAAVGGWNGVVRREALGLLLLLLCAEVARREAREGTVWPVLRPCFERRTHRLLFGQGFPLEETKEALEAAARRFGLRQVFVVAGVQSYYQSIYLQFGFTRHAIDRLPWWLAGYGASEAVAALLHGSLCSPSFMDLWAALVAYRYGSISEYEARKKIDASSWVLPAWADELLSAARRRPDLDAVPQEQKEARPEGLLTPPLLRWDGHDEPCFMSQIVGLEALELTAPRYDLLIGKHASVTLTRQADGSYANVATVTFAAEGPVVSVTLAAPGEPALVQYDLQLWDPLDDVVLFGLPSGRAMNAGTGRMSATSDYALLTHKDIVLEPNPSPWHMMCGGEYRLSLLRRGWSPDLRASLEGIVLWTPYLRQQAQQRLPTWAERIYVRGPLQARLGDTIRLYLEQLPADAMLAFVRLGPRMIPCMRDSESAALEPIVLTPELAASGLHVTLGVRAQGQALRLSREWPLSVSGAARLTGDGWQVVTPDSSITVEQTRQPWRLFLPTEWQPDERWVDLAVMEGHTYLHRPERKTRPLGQLAGYGGAVRICQGPYNATGTILPLAASVSDPGILRAATTLFGKRLVLSLAWHNEPSPQHSLVLWQEHAELHMLPGTALSLLDSETWSADVPGGLDDNSVIALAYKGARIGAQWPASLSHLLRVSSETPARTVRQQAALVRWLRLPVLAPPFQDAVNDLIRRAPVDILLAWVRPEGLPDGLQHEPVDAPWLSVVRQLFWKWQPRQGEVRHLLGAFGLNEAHDQEAAAVSAAWRQAAEALQLVSPLLLGVTLRLWVGTCMPAEQRANGLRQVRKLHARLLGIDRFSPEARSAAEAAMREQTARDLGVDSRFLEMGLIKPALAALREAALSPMQVDNLLVAHNRGSFRDLLAARVLAVELQRWGGMR